MAHNVTKRDQMFTVREPAWHFNETKHLILDDHPTPEQAREIAFPWEPVTHPIFRAVPVVGENGPETVYEEIPGQREVVRSDTNEHFGVVGSTWEPATNKDLTEVAEAIQGNSVERVRVETAGSLLGGRKVWMLIRLEEPLFVKGDPNSGTIPYYALQNSHDGLGAFRGQALMTRIVCDNTAQAADLEAKQRGTEFTFRHVQNLRDRIDEAKQALAGWRESVDEWQRMMEHLVEVKVTEKQRETFIQEFVPMPVQGLVSDVVVSNIELARKQIREILAGPTCEGVDLTAYGLVQASIEYGQHYRRAATEETRFKRAYLDRSRLTKDSVELAQMVASL